MSKSEFIRSLQSENKLLSPPEISQRIREKHSCVSTYRGDPKLDVRMYRGYMIRWTEKPNKTPDDPDWYECIISLDQSKQWQDLVWTKEILGILDGPDHWTRDKSSLGDMLDNRAPREPHGVSTPLNVKADKNGLTLALGCAVPRAYRKTLRDQKFSEKYSTKQLETMLLVPEEFIAVLLGPEFETDFDRALAECEQEAARGRAA
jgi:hypothetical protein